MVVVKCQKCEAANRVPVVAPGKPRCAKCRSDLAWLVNASDADFDDVVDTGLLTLVDLWAPWCNPCRMVGPILESLAGEFRGRLKVVKVNVDENRNVSVRFNAQSIPMLLFMRGGVLVDSVVGAHPEPVLRAKIIELL